MSVLSLGLLLPFGAGAFPDRAIAVLTDAAGGVPAKHLTFIDGDARDAVDTRTTTVAGFLRERGIDPQPDDSLSAPLDAPLADGATLTFRRAVPVQLHIDGVDKLIRTAASTVATLLAAQGVKPGPHDTVLPPAQTAVAENMVIRYSRATSWLERIRTAIVPPMRKKYDIAMTTGTQRTVDPGAPGVKETTVEVLQPDPAVPAKKTFLAARVLRFPRAKVVAEGVGDYSSLAGIARRGMAGTVRLADAALKMVATAYTGGCPGCSGRTASGRPAGRGVVAVDPRYIPLGTRLFIPGYGHAYAGDTGGAIHGNRIDLGFDSHQDAMSFGRRPIVVYVLK